MLLCLKLRNFGVRMQLGNELASGLRPDTRLRETFPETVLNRLAFEVYEWGLLRTSSSTSFSDTICDALVAVERDRYVGEYGETNWYDASQIEVRQMWGKQNGWVVKHALLQLLLREAQTARNAHEIQRPQWRVVGSDGSERATGSDDRKRSRQNWDSGAPTFPNGPTSDSVQQPGELDGDGSLEHLRGGTLEGIPSSRQGEHSS